MSSRLLIIGGAAGPALLGRFVELSGARQARIVAIATAGAVPEAAHHEAFAAPGAGQVEQDGLGVGEDTAILTDGERSEVLGNGTVTVVDAGRLPVPPAGRTFHPAGRRPGVAQRGAVA